MTEHNRFSRTTINELADFGALKEPTILFQDGRFIPRFTLNNECVFCKDSSGKLLTFKLLQSAEKFMEEIGFNKNDIQRDEDNKLISFSKNIFDITKHIASSVKITSKDDGLRRIGKEYLLSNIEPILELEEDHKKTHDILCKESLSGKDEIDNRRQFSKIYLTLKSLKMLDFDIVQYIEKFNKIADKYNLRSYSEHESSIVLNRGGTPINHALFTLYTIEVEEKNISSSNFKLIVEYMNKFKENHESPNKVLMTLPEFKQENPHGTTLKINSKEIP